jgi:alpha-L-fucosidase
MISTGFGTLTISLLKSVDKLMQIYEQSVGRGGQLMLGLAPDRRGLLPEADVARLREFGDAIRTRYSKNLAARHSPTDPNTSAALDGNPETFWSAPTGSHHALLEVDFPAAVTFNRALTQEWLNDGQHIQKYAIEIWEGNGWKTIAAAQAIGHKKIDAFPALSTTRVRLNILSSTSEAHIREFQLYHSE